MENFITAEIDKDLLNGKCKSIKTRFPPEPNGYLHLGHAKSICLNFGIAEKYNGKCNLRYDDTNPSTETEEFAKSIEEDLKWLGFNPSYISYASDYFEEIYDAAHILIARGLAYVCDLTSEEISSYRGTLVSPGKNSPYRNRSVEENLRLFMDMKSGLYAAGTKTLRAKIDMASPNMNMRDPVIYRIDNTSHFRTGTKWNIYPTYDFAHPLCDCFENISHSICTLEFEDHRPLYDWVVRAYSDESAYELFPDTEKDVLESKAKCSYYLHTPDLNKPRQIEFARLNVEGITLSKRKLASLISPTVKWDDANMPTISGLRNRGISAAAIRKFCEEIGVAKFNGTIDPAVFNKIIRDELNKTAKRVMAVRKPLNVKLLNFTGTKVVKIENNPEDTTTGAREVEFGTYIFISEEDFAEIPPKGFHRLTVGSEVRLKSAGIIKCEKIDKSSGTLECSIDHNTERKVKSTIHWVNKDKYKVGVVELLNPLFLDKDCEIINDGDTPCFSVYIEPMDFAVGEIYQFMRMGYFKVVAIRPSLVFREVIDLKDSWKK